MPDYSLCQQSNCPKASSCCRYLGEPSPYRQSYFAPEYDKDGCTYFWDVKKGAPFRLKKAEVTK